MSGCSSNQEVIIDEQVEIIEVFDDQHYAITNPYQLSPARNWHGNVLSRYDAIEVEKGLNQRIQEYFSVEEYILSAGSLLGNDEIQMLQRRESETYPYALNPALGVYDFTATVQVENPYFVYDVVEVNFYKPENTEEIAGIGLVILMNTQVEGISGQMISISDEQLTEFGTGAAEKLVSYFRTREEVTEDLPIYVSLYASAQANSGVPGHYLAQGITSSQQITFETIEEEWLIFPSSAAQDMDANLYSQFLSMKDSIDSFLPENVDVIGLGRFENHTLRSLSVDVNAQAKTYNELYALTQLLATELAVFDTTSFEITCEIKMFDTTYFTLHKPQGESEVSIHDIS